MSACARARCVVRGARVGALRAKQACLSAPGSDGGGGGLTMVGPQTTWISSSATSSLLEVDRRATKSTTDDVIMPGMFAVNVAAVEAREAPSPMPSMSVSTENRRLGAPPRNSSTVVGAAPSTDA